MDPVPFQPYAAGRFETLPDGVQVLQRCFVRQVHPLNVAENLQLTEGSCLHCDFNRNACIARQTQWEAGVLNADITKVEMEVMEKHAKALLEIERELGFEEPNRLKIRGFFELLSSHALEMYNLLQRADLFPNQIRTNLDFMLNPNLNVCEASVHHEHICEDPAEDASKSYSKALLPLNQNFALQSSTDKTLIPLNQNLVLEPGANIIFDDYDVGHVYKKRIKLRNVSKNMLVFIFAHFPKSCPFQLVMRGQCRSLAPGLSVDFDVIFTPKMFKDFKENIHFKSTNNIDAILSVQNRRINPKLVCYLYNSRTLIHIIKKTILKISNQRKEALNFTIDCGTCLLGSNCFVALLMKNKGAKGRFFLTTETEWNYTTLNWDEKRVDELKIGNFIVTPCYFEIKTGEIGQIFITFTPETPDFFTEKVMLICDNNAFQEIELIGDCVLFEKSCIKVVLLDDEVKMLKNVCGDPSPEKLDTYKIRVHNDSGIQFEYYWTIKTDKSKLEGGADAKLIEPDWVSIINSSLADFPTFGSTDFDVLIRPDGNAAGTYFTVLSFYLKNVPPESLGCENCSFCEDSDSEIVVVTKSKSDLTVNSCLKEDKNEMECDNETCDCELNMSENLPKCANLLICELKITVLVEAGTQTIVPPKIDIPKTKKPVVEKLIAKMSFSQCIYDFGVIPKGTKLCKNLVIINETNASIKWKLKEYQFINCDTIEELNSEHLAPNEGYLEKKRKLCYKIEDSKVQRFLSFVAIFVENSAEKYIFDCMTFVTYEIEEVRIRITTETHHFSILCPKEIFFIGLKYTYKIYLSNEGATIGCFYFLKPIGSDKDKIKLTFRPNSGFIEPGEFVEVDLDLIAPESGIFDQLFVPCFVGDLKNTQILRILCAVDGISVNIHLPTDEGDFQVYVWPHRSDLNLNWENIRGLAEGETEAFFMTPSEQGNELAADSLIGINSIALNYPSVRVGRISTKKATKVTFYLENNSPLKGTFSVQAANFSPYEKCFNNALVHAKLKPIEQLWDEECMNGDGIIIEVVPQSTRLKPREKIEINCWIYANTWGKYLEEIMVEVDDLTPFCFNVIVEACGLPLEFPFAMNTILDKPLLRFGYLVYCSGKHTRAVRVANTSAVDLYVTWHVFNASAPNAGKFNFVFDLYGTQPGTECFSSALTKLPFGEECFEESVVEIERREVCIPKNSSKMMNISINTDVFETQSYETELKYNLVGYVHIKEAEKFKENYFRRVSGIEYEQLMLSLAATLESPVLLVELSREGQIFNVFVNNLLFYESEEPKTEFLLRNNNKTCIYFKLAIEEPFKIEVVDRLNVKNGWFELRDGQVAELRMSCNFSKKMLYDFSKIVYLSVDGIQLLNIDTYTSILYKYLEIIQLGVPKKCIPFEVHMHYPYLEVSPNYLKFERCLLFDTKKSILTIINRSGAMVYFEIYKSSSEDTFTILPNAGFVEKSSTTCSNYKIVDIMIYFTPKKPRVFEEVLRITTNIPYYSIEVPISGIGVVNEKFHHV